MSEPIDDILNRQRDRAKKKQQEQQDAEARFRDQAELVELWDNVRYYPGQDAHEWIALISALTLSLDERGLMGRLNEPPAGLGGFDGDEPDAYHLAVAIYRQSLSDHQKAVGLLLEAGKLQETTGPRVNEWLRRELREHVEGRWAALHQLPKEPIAPDAFLVEDYPPSSVKLKAACDALRKRINGTEYRARQAAYASAPEIVDRLWETMRLLGWTVPAKPKVRQVKFADGILGDHEGAIEAFNAAIDMVVAVWDQRAAKFLGRGKGTTLEEHAKELGCDPSEIKEVRHPEAEEMAEWEAIQIVGGKFLPGWIGFRQGCEFWHVPVGSHNEVLSDIEIAWPDLVGEEYSERALLRYLLQQHGISPTDATKMLLADLAKLMLNATVHAAGNDDGDDTGSGMSVEEANEKATRLAAEFRAAFFAMSDRKRVELIGCHAKTWHKTDLYITALKEGKIVPPKTKSPKVISLTDKGEAVVGEGEKDEIQKQAGEIELRRLVAESQAAADGDPSPLIDDPPDRPRKVRQGKRI